MMIPTKPSIKIAPSILAADFCRLGEQVQQVVSDDVDRIHVDVMDGHFVPNISVGVPVVQSLRKCTSLPIETHLMISHPDQYLEAFAQAGADSLLVHVENNPHLHRTVTQIRVLGCKAGVVLNPATPATAIEPILREVDLVLIMTVNPGFGGQTFIEATLKKIEQVRQAIDAENPNCELEIDGGVTVQTVGPAVAAGARVLVAGSSVFRASDSIPAAIVALHRAAEDALTLT
ncbi:MAG: ribulose-phosphate 3-epimerase [Pirellulaceae bacterium]|nr:ribulose-phosphate 3-epimerase [Planctomycetales bacterium]